MAIKAGYTHIYKKRLRAMRELKGISRDELCLRSGVAKEKITNYEVQLTSLSIPHIDLLKLCAAMSIPVGYLTDAKAAILWDGDKVTGKSRQRK